MQKMVTLGWIENAQIKTDKIILLRKFFEVSNLSIITYHYSSIGSVSLLYIFFLYFNQ